jgi:two-component system, chemotaxis family, CheB/CheR fusion protein
VKDDGSEHDPSFEALLEFVHQRHGFDFRGYKRSSLSRRIEKRVKEVGRADFTEYLGFLEAEPREYAQLVNTILINVTAFFRDEPAWRSLEEKAIPEILGRAAEGETIRVWSAGCATGEEAYSLAMLFGEALGLDEFLRRVKIYATDLDEAALVAARNAVYPANVAAAVPKPLLDRYFEEIGGSFIFRRDLRRAIIFGRHNVLTDAPISRVDLLACRNLLIYLDVETQARVLPRLHYAMKEGGFLFLGRAETQIAQSKMFEPADLKSRLFRRRGASAAPHPEGREAARTAARIVAAPRLLEGMIDTAPMALIAIGPKGELLAVNAAARQLLGMGDPDLGRPFHDLQVSYRPVELRSRIEEAAKTRKKVRIEDVELFRPGGAGSVRLVVEVVPLFAGGAHIGTAISFLDGTRLHDVQQQLDAANHMLETTIEELQSANEELETTNEELQSTNEELETTNEELQSTNEELETTNEELRSTNDELEATNDELRARTEQLDAHRRHTEAVLGSIATGIVVVDRELRVTSWNRWNENVWGLRREDAEGKPLLALDIGLPIGRIGDELRRLLANGIGARIDLDAMDRRGRRLFCTLAISPLKEADSEINGLILVVEPRGEGVPQPPN